MPDSHSSQTSTPSGATTTTTTTTVSDDHRPIAGLSLPQILGGALGAVTTAVAASFLGVAGTLIGAAVGSVISTLATTIYSNSLSHAARLSRTLVVRQAIDPEFPEGTASASPEPGSAPGEEPAEKVVEYTTRSGKPAQPSDSTGSSLWSRVRWKPVALLAGVVFVAAMAVITVTELALGHPLGNSKDSGTTFSNISGSQNNRPTTSPTPTATPTASVTPTATGSLGASASVTPSTGTETTSPSATTPGLQTTAPGGSATTSGAAPPP